MDPEERRARILAAAAGVFARDGYHGCRIRDVAQEAGVAYGLVYHYFGSKEALLARVYDENWKAFADAVQGIAASDRDPAEQVRAVLDYVFNAWSAYPDVLRVVVLEYGRTARQGAAWEHDEVRRALEAMVSIFQRLDDADRLPDGADPKALTLLLMGGLEAAIAGSLAPDDDSVAHRATRLRHTLTAVFGDALLGAPRGSRRLHTSTTEEGSGCTST